MPSSHAPTRRSSRSTRGRKGDDHTTGRAARDRRSDQVDVPRAARGLRRAGLGGDALADPHADLRARPHHRRGMAARIARAAANDGPCTVLTFRSTAPEIGSISRPRSPVLRSRVGGAMTWESCSAPTPTGAKSWSSSPRAIASLAEAVGRVGRATDRLMRAARRLTRCTVRGHRSRHRQRVGARCHHHGPANRKRPRPAHPLRRCP